MRRGPQVAVEEVVTAIRLPRQLAVIKVCLTLVWHDSPTRLYKSCTDGSCTWGSAVDDRSLALAVVLGVTLDCLLDLRLGRAWLGMTGMLCRRPFGAEAV